MLFALFGVVALAFSTVERPVGRVVHGQPVVVDFGPQGEGGYPAVFIRTTSGGNVRLRLSYSTHPDGLGEKGDFWHETRATYMGPEVLLPIAPASTDRFDVFAVTNAGVVRASKAQGLVRYVRVAVDTPNATVDVEKVALENRGVHSDEPVVGSFSCSDDELTRIWQASVRTCQLASIPARGREALAYVSDGAKRDRLVWSGDLWWAQRNSYVAFGPHSPYMTGSIDMLAENQTPAGYVNACPYPESRGPVTAETYGPFASDEFAAWFVPVLSDHFRYTGDRALLARRYPNVVKLMDYLAAHQEPDGLFVQRKETAKHSEGLAVGGTSLHHRAYMHVLLWRAYGDAAQLAAQMGRNEDRERFAAAARRLERLLWTRFYDEKEGRFVLSLEQPERPAFVANAAALAFGFATGGKASGILAHLTRNNHGKFQMMAIRGAFECRDGAKALALLNAHNWRAVVRDDWLGVHLVSECMGLIRKGWGDEAHPDTALAGVLTDYVLGVRPVEPGYRTFVVDPIPVPGVTWAKGRVPTTAGIIEVEWRLKDGRPDIRVAAPAGLRRLSQKPEVFDDVAAVVPKPRVRDLVADRRYALFPMWNCGPGELRHKVKMSVDGVPTRVMDLLLPQKDPDWWAAMDISAYRGKTLRFEMLNAPATEYDQLGEIVLSDDPRLPANLHDEAHRPQLRFSAERGWINDPNGLVWQDGKWKLFYQYNPYSVWWGNLHWGYAESTDLVHWTDRGAALFPDAPQQNIISGSGIVDVDDTAGFGKGAHVILVQHGPGLCVWTAPDGKHYEYWKGNPIARGIRGADPKVVWYAKDRRWICLTHGREDGVYTVYINSSPNLREWKEESRFYGDHASKGPSQYMHECPGLEELRIRGEDKTGWILWGANAVSAIGSFDGHVFKPEVERVTTYQKDPTEKKWPWYAAQAFQNAPDGRTVLVPWLRTTMIGFDRRSAFNQAMGIPQELELVRTPEGLRLSRLPVREMDALRDGPAVPFAKFRGELAEVHVSCEPGPDAELAFDFRGVPMTWSAKTQMLTMEPHRRAGRTSVRWPLVNGRLAFRLYLDRVSFEVFSPDGLLSAPFCGAFPDAKKDTISVTTKGPVAAMDARAYRLKSIWSDRKMEMIK